MTETLWMIEHEQAGDDLQAGRIDEAEFRRRLALLGFDPDEIDNELSAIQC